MPLEVVQPFIEQSDFSGGHMPDLEAAAVPVSGLVDVMNLLPDVGSGTPQVRKGFKRLASITTGYSATAMHAYSFINSAGVRKSYLMVVVTTFEDNLADNLRLYSLDLETGAVAQESDPNQTFVRADGHHWGETINGIFYGGGEGNPMYSWNGDTGAYNDDAGAHNYRELVDPSAGIDLATERSTDFAFRKRQEIRFEDPLTLETQSYRSLKDIFYKKWKSGTSYQRGDKVSIRRAWFAGKSWYKSFHCKKRHDADATNRPGDGTGSWQTYWRAVDLDLPRDEESEINADHWALIPEAASTDVAVWHGERLFMRYDDLDGQVGKTRVLYSAPSRYKKGQAITDLTWDARDFGPEDDQGSTGGGFFEVDTGSNEHITAMASFGFYLIIFTHHSTHVLSGISETTWTKRPLTHAYGAVGSRAVVEHQGLVYFFSDQGLAVTDGNTVEEVENGHVIREWLREKVNWDKPRDVNLFSYGGFVWISLSTIEGDSNNQVVVYDPVTASFWQTDLKMSAACVARIGGADQLFFTSESPVGDLSTAVTAWTGTAHRSTSTRVIGVDTRTNLCTSPDFERLAGEDPREVKSNCGWSATTPTKTAWHISSEASFLRRYGAVVRNKRTNMASPYEGIELSYADGSTGTQTISTFVRRVNAKKKDPPVRYLLCRFRVDGVDLPEGDHSYRYVGNGWWRMSATFTGSLTPRDHAVVVRPRREVHVDSVLSEDVATLEAYFDGRESMGDDYKVFGGVDSLVYQYDHEDVQALPTDDTGEAVYASEDIRWHLQTAWWTFSTAQEERRIRRQWALIRGAVETLFRGFRNHDTVVEFETAKSTDDENTTYHEGAIMPDAYAVGFLLEGSGAPAALLGIGVDTQPRRVRYGTPAPAVD